MDGIIYRDLALHTVPKQDIEHDIQIFLPRGLNRYKKIAEYPEIDLVSKCYDSG